MLTTDEIQEQLLSLPTEISSKEFEQERCRKVWQTEEMIYDLVYARKYLEAKAEGIQKSDVKAKEEALENCAEFRWSCISKESEFKKAEIEANKLIRSFESLKKIANTEEALLRRGI
jgi:hypothetical protein